jgi:periplasmic protein TonB
VSPRPSQHRKRYTVPLSILAHGTLGAIFIVAPLVATTELPSPPKVPLPYIVAKAVPAPPPLARTQRANNPAVAPTPLPGVPVEAPDGVAVETGLVPNPATIETGSIEGLVSGLTGPALVADEIPPTPPPLSPVRPGGNITSPTRVKYVPPDYPLIAQRNKVEGIVIIEAIIGIDGSVQDARVIRSETLLDKAALDAVRQWKYTPTRLNGQPTPVIVTITVRFTLR